MSAPASWLKLYSGVPLDNTYKVSFGAYTPTAISGYLEYTITGQYWIRHDLGKIRMDCSYANAGFENTFPSAFNDCNYMTFYNGDIIYYAFITGYKYINDNTVEFDFEIDVLSTYWHGFRFQKCNIEREHVSKNSDVVGAYTLPEPVALGEYECVKTSEQNTDTDQMKLILYMAPDRARAETVMASFQANGRNGVICGCEIFVVNRDGSMFIAPTDGQYYSDGDNLGAVMKKYYDANWTCILAVYVPPNLCGAEPYNPTGDLQITRSTAAGTSLNGVSIQNLKCFTTPYCYVTIDNKNGSSVPLSWELFTNSQVAEFWLYGTCLPTPTMVAIPHNYRGLDKDWDNGVSISNFPQCPVSSDSIANWENANSTAAAIRGIAATLTGALSGAVTGAIAGAPAAGIGAIPGAIAGAAIGAAGGATTSIASYEANRSTALHSPANLTGMGGNANLMINLLSNNLGFRAKYMTLKTDVLQAIDNFFTRYGYRVDRVGYPNLNSRSRFNYIKNYETNIEAVSEVALPAYAARKICEIFNAGCTVWHTTFSFGDYSVN